MLKRCFALAAALLLFMAAGSYATEFTVPEQVIAGADKTIPLGGLVRLRLSPIGRKPEHLMSSSHTWRVLDGDTELNEDDFVALENGFFFGAGIKPRKLVAHCIVVHLYVVKKDGKVSEIATRTVWLKKTIQIGEAPGPDPGPGPKPPDPGPGPEPSFPDGQYKLAVTAYRLAVAKVTDKTARTKGADALKSSFRGLASAIAAGTEKDLVAALKKAKTANNNKLKEAGVDISTWNSFGDDLMEAVYVLYKDKKLNSVADLGVAWVEIAKGLEAVK